MQRPDIIAALDIGTTKICALIGEIKETGEVEIIGFGQSPATGIKKGVVVNLETTIRAIENALQDAQTMAGAEVKEVYTGISGGHIRSFNSNAVIGVQRPDREITKSDVDRVIDNAKAVNIPADMEIIHVLPQEFIIDGQSGIKEPIGMSGVRLETRVHIVSAATTAVQNIIKAINRAGYVVNDIILQSLASARAVLTDEEKELGVALIELGGGTTDIILYNNNGILHSSVIPVGGEHITSDIAVGLRTPRSSAEHIKIQYGVASVDMVEENEIITIPRIGDFEERKVPKLLLAQIIDPRIDELLQMIKAELVRVGYLEYAPTGVVISGGVALMPGFREAAAQALGVPVRLAHPKNVLGLKDIVNNSVYATTVGLLYFAAEESNVKKNVMNFGKGLMDRFISKLKQWFGDFF